MKKYTDQFLLDELRRFYDENGRVPKQIDFLNQDIYPSYMVYIRKYGSWNNAIIKCGLKINRHKRKNLTKEFLLSELYRYKTEFGIIPINRDFRYNDDYPSDLNYTKYFGSWNNALKMCNFRLNVMKYKYDGSEVCSICGVDNQLKWLSDENKNIICRKCYTHLWNKNNLNKANKYRYDHKGYGLIALNEKFDFSDAHHLWLENTSYFSIYIPTFIHKLHYHDHEKLDTMVTPNAIALDYWINEDFYQSLYAGENV